MPYVAARLADDWVLLCQSAQIHQNIPSLHRDPAGLTRAWLLTCCLRTIQTKFAGAAPVGTCDC